MCHWFARARSGDVRQPGPRMRQLAGGSGVLAGRRPVRAKFVAIATGKQVRQPLRPAARRGLGGRLLGLRAGLLSPNAVARRGTGTGPFTRSGRPLRSGPPLCPSRPQRPSSSAGLSVTSLARRM